MASCSSAATLVRNPAERATAPAASPFNVGRGSAAFCSGLRKVDGISRLNVKRTATGDNDGANVLSVPVAGIANSGSNGNLLTDSPPAEVSKDSQPVPHYNSYSQAQHAAFSNHLNTVDILSGVALED